MKFSLVTVVRNDHRVIDCIRSVASQQEVSVEHIIVDGASDDGTTQLIQNTVSDDVVVISEPDEGLYHAINKGIGRATGEIVGFLNADDLFSSPYTLKKIWRVFHDHTPEIVYGNIQYVNSNGRTVRSWTSRPFHPGLFQRSWTPAHPTFYTWRRNYRDYGIYRTDLRIAADVELMYRFLEVHRLPSVYLPEILVFMQTGGVSNRGLQASWIIYREVRKGIRENGGEFNDARYLFSKALKVRDLFLPWRRKRDFVE